MKEVRLPALGSLPDDTLKIASEVALTLRLNGLRRYSLGKSLL